MKTQFNFDLINKDKFSFPGQKQIISQLGKPKNLLKSVGSSNEEKYFSDYSSENGEDNLLFSHNDFSDAINKRLDEYSDDDYSYLKKEIDSFIKSNDEVSKKNSYSKNKSNEIKLSAKQSILKFDTIKKIEANEKENNFEDENVLKNYFSIWQKKRKSSNNLTHLKLDHISDKTKIFIPKKQRPDTQQKEKLKDFTFDTKSIYDKVQNEKNYKSTSHLSAEEKIFVNKKTNKKSKSYLELQKNNFINSSLSTAYNSLCTTPISSPETDVKKTLNGNTENLIFSNSRVSNKNLHECYFEDSNQYGFGILGNSDAFKICHINSFCTISETDSKNNSPQNYYLNNNFIASPRNKPVFNSKVNSVNNNSSSNPNIDNKSSSSKNSVYTLNPNIYYETISNNSVINNNNNFIPSPLYKNTNFCKVPIYQNHIYFNNFNISTSASSYIPKKNKYSNDPLMVLREQTNSMIRTPNGKAVPFEEPHNRINLENILRGKDKRTTLMIRHIPNKYTLQTILEDINIEFKDKYDLFYLPLDFNNNCNLGFAFINFVDPFHILGFYDYFRGKRWRRFNSEKICELAYAKFQGKKELISHFEKGSVMNFDSEDKKPLILPTPDPVAKISLPLKFFDAFLLIYPYSNYEIFEEEKKLVINSFYEF